MAKIIHLFGAKTGRRFNGVNFPQIYRIVGHFYTEALGVGPRAPPSYSLDENCSQGLTNVTATPIRVLDESDTGWLIIRHHATLDHADGYIDCHIDIDDFTGEQALFQADEGIFTLVQRPPRDGTPDHLILYHAGDEVLAIDATGGEHDGSIAYPPDLIRFT